MPAVTLSAVVDLSKIKVKWKEQYVSEALNHKSVSAPKGIYQGLQLVQNITSPRIVSVSSGTDAAHTAVYRSATGFSLSYFDVAGTTFTLDLSSASLDNQETVIALSITYIVGATTAANWMAYPIADWNALSAAAQGELIVLGTINVPAPATNITTSMILPKRRTVAWDSQLPGAAPWSPVVKNAGFEHALQASTIKYAVSDWEISQTPVNATLQTGTTTVHSGAQSLEFAKTSTSSGSAVITQQLEIPVVSGQLIRLVVWVRQMIAPTSGNYFFDLQWGDSGSNPAGATSIDAAVLSATDAVFRKIDQIVQVPSTGTLKWVAFRAASLVTPSTGVALIVDDVQVYLQRTVLDREGSQDSHLTKPMVSALFVEDPNTFTTTPAKLAALLRFDKTLPSVSEGKLIIERKDQNSSNLPPAIDQSGRMFLGSQLLATEANALLPRITAGVSVVGGVEFTLMWESVPSGQPGHRRYVSAQGRVVDTFNAYFDGTNWNKDVSGTVAMRATLGSGGFGFWYIADRDATANTPWADGSWSSDMVFVQADSTSTYCFQTFRPALFNSTVQINSTLTMLANQNIVLSGTGALKQGTRTLRWMTNNPCASFLSGASPSNASSESFGTGSTAAGTWFCPLNPWPSTWRLQAARFYLPSTIVGSSGLLTLQERNGAGYTSISSDYSFTNGESGLKTFAGITAATHAFPIGIRMNLSVGSTTTALVSYVEIDYDIP